MVRVGVGAPPDKVYLRGALSREGFLGSRAVGPRACLGVKLGSGVTPPKDTQDMPSILQMMRNLSAAPALHYKDFRTLWLSSALNAAGFLGEVVALGWILLEITGSPLMVGVGMGVRMAPFFFLGILAGTLADRLDRRNLLLGLSFALAGVMGTLSLIMLSGHLAVWHLLGAAVVVGSLWALYQAARQSFTYDIVGPRDMTNGLTFITLGMRVGGMGGGARHRLLAGPWGGWDSLPHDRL